MYVSKHTCMYACVKHVYMYVWLCVQTRLRVSAHDCVSKRACGHASAHGRGRRMCGAQNSSDGCH